ncbi:Regulatory protein BlaR1 [Gimesia alba]|uniref:Regulatory protein BlaR1 n=1 Tax=Gimesia alba TaxID=2527973 RepID=A0A517RIB6_9PLAN|nr:M56 family metallopeptidase [Gimesia alba]QDT43619.1 Regulatory protein BlaR1 [Gimesia alba]
MNTLATIFQSAWAERVGWTLLHSLWQIALLAIAYRLVSILLRNRPATVRYLICCVTLFSMLGFPLSTFYLLSQNAMRISTDINNTTTIVSVSDDLPASSKVITESEKLITSPQSSVTQSSATESDTKTVLPASLPANSFSDNLFSLLRPWLPLATTVWLIGTLLFALRPLWGWLHVRRLKRHGLSPLSPQLRDLGANLAVRLGIKQGVQFLQSSLVEVPTIVGCFSPIILLPASAITGLTVQELEMILAHELAHVRRHDYLINLAQTVIESLLFYHPGMWWISNQIRQEREHCCDDIAVALGKNRAVYVQALARLEQQRHETLTIVLTATGGLLISRVRRILEQSKNEVGYVNLTACLTGLVLIGLVATAFTMNSIPQKKTIVLFPSEQNSKLPEGELSVEIPNRLIKVIQAYDLPFFNETDLDQIRKDFRLIVEKYAPENMSDERKRSILTAIEEHSKQHLFLTSFDPNRMDSLNETYLFMPDRLKTLQWKLSQALQRDPLSKKQAQRREELWTFMSNHIKSLPETSHVNYQTALEDLKTRFTDPLCTQFDRPLTEEQFNQFKNILQRSSNNSKHEIEFVVSHLSWYVQQAYRPYTIGITNTLPFDDEVKHANSSNGYVTLGFTSNEIFRGKVLDLEDFNNSYTLIDMDSAIQANAIPQITVPATAREPDKISHWLNQTGKGDFGYKNGELFAVRGTKLALLNVKNWFEADAISKDALRAEIKKQDKHDINVKNEIQTYFDQFPTRHYTEYIGPYIGVLNQEGHLSVVHIKKIPIMDGIYLNCRPRL